jgi:hypothetical protein
MERLSRTDEDSVLAFHGLLWGVCSVEDMFPPDLPPYESGDREPRRPLPPHLPLSRQLVAREAELCITRIDLALAAS